MKISTPFLAALAAAPLMLCCALSMAFAQTVASPTTISGQGFFEIVRPYLEVTIAAVVTGVLGWLAATVQKYLGVNIEAKHREALHAAVMTGVTSALNRLDASAERIQIDVKNQALAEAVKWVEKSVPEALAYFKVTPEAIRQLAESKLEILAAASTTPTTTQN